MRLGERLLAAMCVCTGLGTHSAGGEGDAMGECQGEEGGRRKEEGGELVAMVLELSNVAGALNTTEGPFAFPPTLPDAQPRRQDPSPAGGSPPPGRRDTSHTHTHTQIYTHTCHL